MCGTCKYCLGFFQIAAVFSGMLLTTVIAIFYLYGGMPPTFAMAVGFWIEYTVGWLSIYLTFYIVRVIGRGLFTSWTPRYCLVMIIVIMILFLAASICFFIPVDKDRMIAYSRWYKRQYNDSIPNFLDKFQTQYQCCGIVDYKDYMNPDHLGKDGIQLRNETRKLLPSDPYYYIWERRKGKTKSKMYMNIVPLVRRVQRYYSVPASCCKPLMYDHHGKDCGKYIEHTGNSTAHHPSALERINNVAMGCESKYGTIMGNDIFQLNWLVGILRWGSLFQSLFYLTLIWIYRLSLKAMKRTFGAQLVGRNDAEDAIPEHMKRELLHLTNSRAEFVLEDEDELPVNAKDGPDQNQIQKKSTDEDANAKALKPAVTV